MWTHVQIQRIITFSKSLESYKMAYGKSEIFDLQSQTDAIIRLQQVDTQQALQLFEETLQMAKDARCINQCVHLAFHMINSSKNRVELEKVMQIMHFSGITREKKEILAHYQATYRYMGNILGQENIRQEPVQFRAAPQPSIATQRPATIHIQRPTNSNMYLDKFHSMTSRVPTQAPVASTPTMEQKKTRDYLVWTQPQQTASPTLSHGLQTRSRDVFFPHQTSATGSPFASKVFLDGYPSSPSEPRSPATSFQENPNDEENYINQDLANMLDTFTFPK